MLERGRIRALVDSCDGELAARRVLIPRLLGMEDSSRYWSIWMTLDHLRITNLAFAHVMEELTQGRVPEGKASTAAVKPDPGVGAGVDSEYEKSCETLLAVVDGVKEWRSEPRYEHPWFGPMNAQAWHGLAGAHMGIHRTQMEEILRCLRRRS
ncbi:MAG: DinB family protein [Blastochloris sp.]|nr:DinB family protein [Blastochloris sp.]